VNLDLPLLEMGIAELELQKKYILCLCLSLFVSLCLSLTLSVSLCLTLGILTSPNPFRVYADDPLVKINTARPTAMDLDRISAHDMTMMYTGFSLPSRSPSSLF
jgi:hypothetical protein